MEKSQKLHSKFFVYILKCSDGTYYTGYTNNLEKRVNTHNAGKGAKYTRCRLPVQLVYFIECKTKEKAMSLEWSIKHKMTRKEKEKLIYG